MAKTYAGTYLYSKYHEYEQKIFDFLMTADSVDKYTDDFDDIRYEVKKRQVSSALVKILDSKSVILMIGKEAMTRPFKVFCAKDVKMKSDKMKVFIDVTNVIVKNEKTGRWECKGNNIDILISYLVSAMHTYIYYIDENRMVNNGKVISAGAQAYAQIFTHVVDYVCKISAMPSTKSKCMYLTALYYLTNLLGKDIDYEGSRKTAMKISGLSDRDAGIVDMMLQPESMRNIKAFSETLSTILHLNRLTLDVIVERWMTIYGTGTVFALELFPAFATMMTDAYVGAYLNNQKAIEKVAGSSLVEFTKILLSIGAESV